MEYIIQILLLFFLIKDKLASVSEVLDERDKIDLRRELDKMTQDLLVDNKPFYHSYVFNSGVGNREKLVVDWIRQDTVFSNGRAVDGWQAVRNLGYVHLLGRQQTSVTLMTAAAQLSPKRSLQIQEHSISFEANVTSASLLTKLHPATSQPEVVVVVAVDTSTADIMFYRITNGKLEYITQWSRYKQVSSLSAVSNSMYGNNQLIVIDKGSQATIDVFDVQFIPGSAKIDFRLVQSFSVAGDCRSLTVCRVGRQHYLVLPLSQRLAVYHLVAGHYQLHKELSLPGVSQVVCFNVALQTYLAVNGESSQVIRVTQDGQFVSELMPGFVSEWLVLPVSSYRSDVLLLSKSANLTTAYAWAGANRGFDAVSFPNCDGCLEGDWSGAVTVPFQRQNCLLIPRGKQSSSLVIIGTSLQRNNPTLDKLKATIEQIKKIQDEWIEIKSRLAELQEKLRFVVKKEGTNVITGKWTVGKLEGPNLKLNSMVQPKNETNTSKEETAEVEEGLLQMETLENSVKILVSEGSRVSEAVKERERQAWGLNGFKGKVNFKGKLIINNLTISHLNGENVDLLLRNSFRKDKPRPIQHQVIVEAIQTEDIVVSRINNLTREDLKFADGPVVISGNVTLEKPLTVRGEVELMEGGRVNGVDLSEELCTGQDSCSVFPMVNLNEEEVRNGDLNNNIDKSATASVSDHPWGKVIAGNNLTVVKVNGVDWKTLTENVVYKNVYQNISGTVVVNGRVTSDPAVWSDRFQSLHKSPSQSSASDSRSSNMVEDPLLGVASELDARKLQILDELPSTSTLIVTELEVMGSVTVVESEWGADAADVVLSDANPIVIEGSKTFIGAVNVTNNTEVEGTVGGVVVADLFTRDTDQVFNGPTTIYGDITVDHLYLSGLWNGKNMSADVITDNHKDRSDIVVTADTINVLETINQVPVSMFVFTGDDGVTRIKSGDVEELSVTENIVVDGKVCGVNLDDFNDRRLSLSKEQNITGKILINNVKVTADFRADNLSFMGMPSLTEDTESEKVEKLHLSELHINGDITTEEGVNGFNLSEVASSAVWLEDNNEIEGPLIFKDEVAFEVLEGQGMCNEVVCEQWLDVGNLVFKNNDSVTFSGSKMFKQTLNISEDLELEEINSHKIKNVLTKTSEQEISGELIIDGDVRVEEESTVHGLINNQNLTEFGHRCLVSGNTITCKGNALFKDNVVVEHFNPSGKTNEIEFLTFLKSIVRTDSPQPVKGLKRFIGNEIKIESLNNLDDVNGENWNNFLLDSVSAVNIEQVDKDVTFSDVLTVGKLSVDYQIAVDTVNSVNISQWKTDAIYINTSHSLEREIVLETASSKGDVSVETYGGLSLEHDVIRLHSASALPFLRARSVTVLEDFDATDKVNGKYLGLLEQNTLKTSGDQTIHSDLIVGELSVDGDVYTEALVDEHQLRDAVTLASDQTLHGKYEFECMEALGNVISSEMITGINLTSWTQTGVLKSGRPQKISGVWRVQGAVEMKGPVTGGGRLADVDLQQLTDTITTDILDVHAEMKHNLTEACEEANAQLASARGQTCRLQYLDITQTFSVPSGPSLVTHFKSGDEDYLAVSEKSCTTTIYKWNKTTGMFASLHREMFGHSLKTFIMLNDEQITYVLTESSQVSSNCDKQGKHLWIFMKDHFKYVSNVNFFDGDLFQGEGKTMYVVNTLGMFKYVLNFDVTQGRAGFESSPHRWNITSDDPKQWSGAVQSQWLGDVPEVSKCSGDVISVSADPDSQFVAVASTEPTEVPRHADFIKIYRRDGRLFDKLPAQSVTRLQWLSVPSQTWLVALQNYSMLNLYQLQGPLIGFQQMMSVSTDATNVTTVSLPLASKVNLQPYILLQSSSAVKLVRAFVQGDPYLGKDLICDFDQLLKRVPIK